MHKIVFFIHTCALCVNTKQISLFHCPPYCALSPLDVAVAVLCWKRRAEKVALFCFSAFLRGANSFDGKILKVVSNYQYSTRKLNFSFRYLIQAGFHDDERWSRWWFKERRQNADSCIPCKDYILFLIVVIGHY